MRRISGAGACISVPRPYQGTGTKHNTRCVLAFWEEDVKHILAIPVNCNMDDFLAWHYDTKGLFSVKSMYHILEDNRDRRATRRDSSTPKTNANQEDWENL